MTQNKTDIIFDEEVIRAFIDEAIKPNLADMADEIGRQIFVEFHLARGEEWVPLLAILKVGNNGLQELCCKTRLKFRKTFGDRILMQAEALFDRENTVLNCSGFSMKAEKRGHVVNQTAYTVRY